MEVLPKARDSIESRKKIDKTEQDLSSREDEDANGMYALWKENHRVEEC